MAGIDRGMIALLLATSCADPGSGETTFATSVAATTESSAASDEASGPGEGATTAATATTASPTSSESEGGMTSSADTGTTGAVPTDPFECDALGDAVVFCSDFEEGDFSIWDDYDGNPPETNTLLEDAGPFALAGNHVGRIRVPPGRGGADFVKVLPSTYDRLFARWYIAYEVGFDFDAPNHGGGLHAGNRDWLGHSDTQPLGDDWFSSWLEYQTSDPRFVAYTYYRGMYQDCVDPGGSCWGDHFPCMEDEGETYCTEPQHRETVTPPPIVAGQWYCVEMMMDGGTPSTDGSVADGQLDFWVDGQEIGPWTDLWLRTSSELQLGLLWLNLFHHQDHSVEGVMYDHVVVSTDRIGCL